MANNPCLGVAVCPYCRGNNPVVWNGNRNWKCLYCGVVFRIKRQKLKNVERLKKEART